MISGPGPPPQVSHVSVSAHNSVSGTGAPGSVSGPWPGGSCTRGKGGHGPGGGGRVWRQGAS